MMIHLYRQGDDLEVRVDGQCLLIQGHYQRPRLLTLDPMRSVFSKRRRSLFLLQHQLHMATGWISMAMHADRVLYEASALKDGDTCEINYRFL